MNVKCMQCGQIVDSSTGCKDCLEKGLPFASGPQPPGSTIPRNWQPEAPLVFKTKDHPAAGGRKPFVGEKAYTQSFTLDDGRVLQIEMGQEGFDTTSQLLLDMLAKTPSYDDGSLKPTSDRARVDALLKLLFEKGINGLNRALHRNYPDAPNPLDRSTLDDAFGLTR